MDKTLLAMGMALGLFLSAPAQAGNLLTCILDDQYEAGNPALIEINDGPSGLQANIHRVLKNNRDTAKAPSISTEAILTDNDDHFSVYDTYRVPGPTGENLASLSVGRSRSSDTHARLFINKGVEGLNDGYYVMSCLKSPWY